MTKCWYASNIIFTDPDQVEQKLFIDWSQWHCLPSSAVTGWQRYSQILDIVEYEGGVTGSALWPCVTGCNNKLPLTVSTWHGTSLRTSTSISPSHSHFSYLLWQDPVTHVLIIIGRSSADHDTDKILLSISRAETRDKVSK